MEYYVIFHYVQESIAHHLNQNKHICLHKHYFFMTICCLWYYLFYVSSNSTQGLSVVDESPTTYSILPCLLHFSFIHFLIQINNDCVQKQNLGHPVIIASHFPISIGRPCMLFPKCTRSEEVNIRDCKV